MKLIFDFDHTVFDMTEMHKSLKDSVVGLGVSKEHYQDAYNDVTQWKMFTLSDFSQRISRDAGVDAQQIERAFDSVAKESFLYIYDDVESHFERLKTAGHKIYLLSWGDADWQEKKIKESGLMKHCEEVVSIPEIKASYIREKHPESDCLVLIDDRPAELKAVLKHEPHMKVIRVRRENGKYSDIQTPHGIPEATNMAEVFTLIENMKCARHDQ